MALPYTDSATAIKYIHKKNPGFIVLEGRLMNLRPYTREWLEKGIPDTSARLIYSRGLALEDRITLSLQIRSKHRVPINFLDEVLLSCVTRRRIHCTDTGRSDLEKARCFREG